jgi:hypothetical protein
MKFREQQPGSVASRTHWILRMALLPGREHIVRTIKIQAVKQLKSAIKGRSGNHGIGR